MTANHHRRAGRTRESRKQGVQEMRAASPEHTVRRHLHRTANTMGMTPLLRPVSSEPGSGNCPAILAAKDLHMRTSRYLLSLDRPFENHSHYAGRHRQSGAGAVRAPGGSLGGRPGRVRPGSGPECGSLSSLRLNSLR